MDSVWPGPLDCSAAGFAKAMDISCHSFIRMAKLAEPLMREGGSLITVSYYGAEKVMPHYNVMGVAKAALEASTRYMARDLGPKGIRVNAICPGWVDTEMAAAASLRLFFTVQVMMSVGPAVRVNDAPPEGVKVSPPGRSGLVRLHVTLSNSYCTACIGVGSSVIVAR